MIIPSVKLPKRLQAVPELGPYEIHVGALATAHVGLTIGVQRRHNTLTGPLRYVPMQSMGNRNLLVLHLGDFTTALHPAAKVWVIPEGYRATITIAPKEVVNV